MRPCAGRSSQLRRKGVKTWERLDRISRDLCRKSGDDLRGINRCTEAHFEDLLERLARDHPGDHNLPRTLETITGYFQEFCADCAETLPEDYAGEADDISGSDLSLLPGGHFKLASLQDCIAALTEMAREIICASYGLTDAQSNVVPLSAESFYKPRA